jgi:transposase InsO family protein
MKGMYNGASMKAHDIFPGAKTLQRLVSISPEAKKRLKWFDWYGSHGRNASLTCRHFGISPDTFYRWKKRFKPRLLLTLESYSTKPKTFRKSSTPHEVIQQIITLRRENMALSKYKIAVILRRDNNINLSPSTIGRILTQRGLIEEASVIKGIKKRKRISWRIPRLRVAMEQRYKAPGNLVQIDTKQIIILGATYIQFTAIDCYTKIGYSRIYRSSGTINGKDFLINLLLSFPFKVKAIQTDNGHEFLLHFHSECIKRGITHFFSRPRTPTDNSMVERIIQTTEYELWLFDETIIPDSAYLNKRLSGWFDRYNTYRPHQSLNYLTPMEYYQLKTKGGVYGRL